MAAGESIELFSLATLHHAISNNQFNQLAAICDRLELENAANGQVTPPDWPYAIHILGHLHNNDLNNARFLWKRIPAAVKQKDAEVIAAWRIGQAMWLHDRPNTYEALRSYTWSPTVQLVVTAVADNFSKRTFDLLCKSYSTISVADAAAFLGNTQNAVIQMTTDRGWSYDPAAGMLTVHTEPVKSEQKTNLSHMQVLTEYVFHLEH